MPPAPFFNSQAASRSPDVSLKINFCSDSLETAAILNSSGDNLFPMLYQTFAETFGVIDNTIPCPSNKGIDIITEKDEAETVQDFDNMHSGLNSALAARFAALLGPIPNELPSS
ncbi:hypothetical protein PTTG_08036 [Puccinia triticina 1-1 BBBD Race 1]|uniref:Uncharacterized protein n=1 Tax=Puccinia triticina (isolate 1-1 / race 1 (BBBD)) TaxID=630390 RepID=A0A0C4F4J6_PUCT1|nr:hypothetical protein PTTG_08036 [Puccinia triticina 1-1 BBBD Race 1]